MSFGRERWDGLEDLDDLPLLLAQVSDPGKDVTKELKRICYLTFMDHREELGALIDGFKEDPNIIHGEVGGMKDYNTEAAFHKATLSLKDNLVTLKHNKSIERSTYTEYFRTTNGEVYPMCLVCHNHILVRRPTTDKFGGTLVCPIGYKRFDSDET